MGDPRQSCPASRNDATRFTMFCVIHAELFQGQQPEFPDKMPCSALGYDAMPHPGMIKFFKSGFSLRG